MIITHRSAYFAALLARHAPDASRIAIADFEAPVFSQLLEWVYTGTRNANSAGSPTGTVPRVESEAAHDLLTAANFLTLADCVRVVVAQVVAALTPVRTERARAHAQIAHLTHHP